MHFRQERVGRKGEPLVIYKFRTMCVDAEAKLAALREALIGNETLFNTGDDLRVTCVARFLKKFSFDELLRFWAVLRGDSVVVGPQPRLARQSAGFPDEGVCPLMVKPGITRPRQVSGRSDVSLEENTRLSLRYVESWTVAADPVTIIIKSVNTTLRPPEHLLTVAEVESVGTMWLVGPCSDISEDCGARRDQLVPWAVPIRSRIKSGCRRLPRTRVRARGAPAPGASRKAHMCGAPNSAPSWVALPPMRY